MLTSEVEKFIELAEVGGGIKVKLLVLSTVVDEG